MNKANTYALLLFVMSGIMIISCTPLPEDNQPEESPLLAEVYNRKLFATDLEGLAPMSDKNDSLAITKAFIERWVREQVLLHEAELNIPPDLQINKLVRDYRASLIVNNYKQQLISNQLDSIVSFEEIEDYYNKNKEQYHLGEDIVQLRLVRLKQPIADLNRFRTLWRDRDSTGLAPLIEFCDDHQYDYILNDSSWHNLNDIIATLPQGHITGSTVKYKKNYEFSDDEFRYFVWIIELMETQEIAPLRYIQDQARRVIMHRKQQELINSINDDLFDKAIQENKVKIYQ